MYDLRNHLASSTEKVYVSFLAWWLHRQSWSRSLPNFSGVLLDFTFWRVWWGFEFFLQCAFVCRSRALISSCWFRSCFYRCFFWWFWRFRKYHWKFFVADLRIPQCTWLYLRRSTSRSRNLPRGNWECLIQACRNRKQARNLNQPFCNTRLSYSFWFCYRFCSSTYLWHKLQKDSLFSSLPQHTSLCFPNSNLYF